MGNLPLNPGKHAYPVKTQVDAPPADTPDSRLECPPAKRVALRHASALGGLSLQIVLQFAGKDEGIFVSSVCKTWKELYESTFKDEDLCTHPGAAARSITRLHWIWSEWDHLEPGEQCLSFYGGYEIDASWYVGKYSPRIVVEEAISDDLLKISGSYLMHGIAASGRLSLVDKLWDTYVPALIEQDKIYALARLGADAAAFGHLAIFALVWSKLEGKDQFRYCGRDAVEAAASKGYVHILEFLSLTDWWNVSGVNGPPEEMARVAASNAQVEVLRWLHDHEHGFDEEVALVAAFNGDVLTLEFLLTTAGCPFIGDDLISCCVQYGNVDALRWFHDNVRPRQWRPDFLQKWLLIAGTFDRKGVAKYLLQQEGAVWPDIGQWFGKDIDCHDVSDDYTQEKQIFTCIWNGSFMEWALAEGCTYGTWTVSTCARLIKEIDWGRGNRSLLDTLVWAHSHGCPCACPRDSVRL